MLDAQEEKVDFGRGAKKKHIDYKRDMSKVEGSCGLFLSFCQHAMFPSNRVDT